VIARGSARAFTHLANEHDSLGPSLDYSRGAIIDVLMKADKVDRVWVTGKADGVHLEPLPPASPDSAKKDTAKTTRKKAPRAKASGR